MFTTHVIRASS